MRQGSKIFRAYPVPINSGDLDKIKVINKSGGSGKDGVSCTHKWSGTVLTVTSASGTSSADLKGEPGKDGATPHIGDNGNWWVGETDTGIYASGSGSNSVTDMFAMSVDEDGNLWVHYEEDAKVPMLKIDEDGNLYYVIEE